MTRLGLRALVICSLLLLGTVAIAAESTVSEPDGSVSLAVRACAAFLLSMLSGAPALVLLIVHRRRDRAGVVRREARL